MKIFLVSIVSFLTVSNSFAHRLPPEVKKIVDEIWKLEGDSKKGQGLMSKCVSCHGADGVPESMVFPYIADQTPVYLSVQLASFKTEHRKSPVMNILAKGLSSQDMADLLAFLQSQRAREAHCDKLEKDSFGDVAEGETLARKEREFTRSDGSIVKVSCTMCHGDNGLMPEGSRERTMHPDLAGLGAEYVLASLKAFKSGKRTGGPMGIMTRDLNDQDLKNLAAYYSSLKRCR